MKSIEHSLLLKDGRTLAYHTFGEDRDKASHPILYFHGLPGCGLEAGIACAPSVAKAGGRIYAIDRPGMGKTSSPYGVTIINSEDEEKSRADKNLEIFMGNIWELVEDQGWKEFSIIGVSGGGPYALALLKSYLERKNDDNNAARLVNVCLVGAMCFSAGKEGMKDDLAQMGMIVEKAQTSKWYRLLLWSMAISMGPMYNHLLPAMPLSWTKYLISLGSKSSPAADREWLSKDENILPFLEMTQSMVAQGGYPGNYDDVVIALRADQPHEAFLRKMYSASANINDLPSIGIFQGGSDGNVPPSHAEYLHKSIFQQHSKVFRYEGLGHESTIMGKSDDYAAFATAERKKYACFKE